MKQTGRILTFAGVLSVVALALPDAALTQTQAPPVRAVSRGPHAVTVESYNTLATHTTYHPADLSVWGVSKRLPVVSWGNGACARNGMAFSEFLTQIASHGYVVKKGMG